MTPEQVITAEAELWLKQWPDGLIALDERYRIWYINPAAEQALGYSLFQIKGEHVHDVLCSSSREVNHSKAECPLCLAEAEHEITSTLWVNTKGKNLSVDYRIINLEGLEKSTRVLSFQNNDARLHNQAEMETFAEYVEKSPTPIGEFDIDGQMIYGNTALQEQLLEYGFDDCGNAKILPANVGQLCNQVYRDQAAMSGLEVEFDEVWFTWHFYPMEGGEGHSVMGFAYNITEQKYAQIHLEREKAEARRDFYAKMVHELRTPLNAIIGFSQILQKRTQNMLEKREQDAINAIRIAGLQLNEMVSDTLDISKIDAGKMEVHNEVFGLSTFIDTFKDQLLGLAEVKGLAFTLDYEPGVECYSDPKKIRQIVINLVSNAIKYTPSGYVKTRFYSTHHERFGDSVGFEVEDSGVGIPKEQIHKLFGAYQQVSEEQNRGIQGTGLGLALVNELVQLLNGEIGVHSMPGQGSTFTFVWPKDVRLLL